MMKGSRTGSVSPNSSANAMRIGGEVEEARLAAPPLEPARRFELEQRGDQSVVRMKHQGVQRPLRARALGRGILRQRQLEERMQMDALAAAPGVFKNHTGRADVAGAGEPRVYAGGLSVALLQERRA